MVPVATIPALERLARDRLAPAEARAGTNIFLTSDSTPSDITHSANLAAFRAVSLRPRVMVDVSRRDLSTEVLGRKIALPVMLAPVGLQKRFHANAESASARAAGSAGTIMALSTISSHSLEDVAAAATGPVWFQLYIMKNPQVTEDLVRRAERSGYSALVVTVDLPGDQNPEIDSILRPEVTFGSLAGYGIDMSNYLPAKSLSFTWADLHWLRSITSLPIVLKGIQTAEDAELCAEHGVDGLVVSNHGGHTVGGARATMTVLPEVVEAVHGRVEIYLDGGVRSGVDVLKALAAGARAVLIGRPMLWGLLAEGEAGVKIGLDILRNELDLAMSRCGVTAVRALEGSLIS